jgi:hypothetical protein
MEGEMQASRQAKLDKIDAEIARMEVQFALECDEQGNHLGPKMSTWNPFSGQSEKDKLTSKTEDIETFTRSVLQVVCSKLSITADAYTPDSAFLKRVGKVVPAAIWKFSKDRNGTPKSYMILFWVADDGSSAYSVIPDDGALIDKAKLGVSQVWSKEAHQADRKDGKKYRFVRAQFHGILMLVTGDLPEYE